ncbi:fork head family transcription factor, partial [Scheffersomyces stipitis CBS 6054]
TKNASYNAKMTTPPESVFVSKKKTLSFTPNSQNIDLTNNHINHNQDHILQNAIITSRSLLLSPAFSSPQRPNKFNSSIGLSSPAPAKSFNHAANSYMDPNSSFLSSDSAKKVKKSKASKDTAFDLHSEDKPPYSYATLIGISILSNEYKKLTLSQIYSWISDTFKYYKREDVGWQNSIRHNLSLNKAFVKGEKSKDGKGHFWCIKDGFEEQFLKSRSVKKSSYHEVMDQIRNANLKNREDTKRTMNAIPSSPNIANESFEEQPKKRKVSDLDRAADYDGVYDYTYDDEDNSRAGDDEDITHILDPPVKKHKPDSMDDPFKQWDDTINLHNSNNLTKTPTASNPPQFTITGSPNKPLLAGKNLTYTSSFSCNSNLELSPIRPTETGPLLEPITPGTNAYQQNQTGLQQLHPPINTTSLPSLLNSSISSNQPGSSGQKTPKSNVLRTPLRNLRTPQTNSIMKKLWNSPSYLDDFYFSPLVNNHIFGSGVVSRTVHHSLTSYDDDDMILRNYEHNQQQSINSSPFISSASVDTSRNLFNDFKKVDESSAATSVSESSSAKDAE